MDLFFYITIIVGFSLIYYGYIKKKDCEIRERELELEEMKIELEMKKLEQLSNESERKKES